MTRNWSDHEPPKTTDELIDWWVRNGYQEPGRDPGPMPAPYGGWVTFDPRIASQVTHDFNVITALALGFIVVAVVAMAIFLAVR